MQRRFQRFEVIDELGSGTMGAVFRARDPQLERDVAIKVLARPATGTREALSPHDTIDLRKEAPAGELLGEARLMARLSHPNVLPVYEVGLAGDQVFLVMERIAGTDLRTWLETPRSTAAIVEAFLQAGRGLAAAHAEGIIHRDFKPENVLVGQDDRVRVADFGLSQLSGPAPLLRVEEAIGGTPFYMAPELWRGAPATAASDVFAFCKAFAEALGATSDERPAVERALRARRIEPALRAAILAGLADDPAARPTLPAIVVALGAHGRRRRWWWIAIPAAGGALAAGAVAVWLSAAPGEERPCAADQIERVPPASAIRRAELVRAEIDQTWDKRRGELLDAIAATCAAERAGELTAETARVRASCIERRDLDLDARYAYLVAHPVRNASVYNILAVEDCSEIVAPARTADRATVAALFARLVDAEGMPLAAPGRADKLAAVARDARAAGERELEGTASESLGLRQIEADHLTAADASLARSYEIGNEIRDQDMMRTALVKRAMVAHKRGEAKAAQSLARLALDLTDRPGVASYTRVYIYHGLALAEIEGGQPGAALDLLRRAREVMRDHPEARVHMRSVNLAQMHALSYFGDRSEEALTLAREHLELAREELGEHNPDFGTALNVVAAALRRNNRAEEAIEYRRRALDVMAAAVAPDHSLVLAQRGNLALDLHGIGRFEEARRELAQVIADSARNEAARASHPDWRADLGVLTFDTGRFDEGIRIFEQGLDDVIAQRGVDHPDTLDYRAQLVGLLAEVGRLDETERQLDTLERHARGAHDGPRRIAEASGIHRAALARLRRRPQEAERRTRETLAGWAELRGDDDTRVSLLRMLGQSLADQQRWREALEQLDRALELARTRHHQRHVLAMIEADRARVLLGMGRRADARALARQARDVLEAFPGEPRARATADAVLKATRR